MLTYGIDSLRLSKQKVHEFSMSYNTAVHRCFYLFQFTFLLLVLSYTGPLPFNMMNEKLILLVKECMNVTSTSILRLCELLASDEEGFVNMSERYKVDNSLSKCYIKEALYNAFVNDVAL